jgi:centromere/kinetochore protein ZW10
MSLEDVTGAMSELGILDTYISRFHRDLDTVIINPLFTVDAKGMAPKAIYRGPTVQLSKKAEIANPSTFVQGVDGLVRFITKELPERLYQPLLEKLLPSLMVQLITNSLDPSVPVDLNHMSSFKGSLMKIEDLADCIDTLGVPIPSDGDLSSWVERLPQIWLARRREASLAQMRSISYEGAKTKKTAERVETQIVSSDDVMVANGQGQEDDEWNADWAEEDEADDSAQADVPKSADDDEDASAWGLEDESEAEHEESRPAATEADGEDEEEAWGWGDSEDIGEEDTFKPPEPATPVKPTPKPKAKTPPSKRQPPTEREITLRETFAITAIPDSILELINMILTDASTLSTPSFPIHSISVAAPALSSLPTLLLAFYRATARTSYASEPAADMLIYNDSQHLAGCLETLLAQLSTDHPLHKRLTRSLEAEIKLLHTYSRLAYGREMDSQRTILSDLLSATSGFDNCTSPLNKREYDGAVGDVIHRVRELNKIWSGVLSDSARLQSLGTILSHVIRRVTTEIFELSDDINGISDEESKTLKGWMDQISALSDLFEQETAGAGEEEKRTVVHVYTPGWLRFIYLGEILEASLVDIKFLWNEAELSLEFEANEVEDLIKALFAESQFRRDAIREIKGSGR